MLGRLSTVLVRPDRFFDDWEPAAAGPVAAVATVGVVSLASVLPGYLSIGDPEGIAAEGGRTVAFAAGDVTVQVSTTVVEAMVTGLLAPVILWPFYAGLLALFAAPEQGFRDVFYRVGWGFLPHGVASLATLVATLAVLESTPTASVRVVAIGAASHATVLFEEPRTAARVARLVGHACTVWGGVVWTAALVYGHGVERSRAATVTGGLVALLLFLSTVGLG